MKTSLVGEEPSGSVASYQRAIERASSWLTAQQRDDGSSGENLALWAYYTQPMAFRAMGKPVNATRTLSFIKRNFLAKDGSPVVQRGGIEGITYAPGWAAVNSQMLERFDISYPLSGWIAAFQDPQSGGFYVSKEDMKRQKGLLEFDATIMSGHAMLSTGQLARAEKVGRLLLKIHRAQPDIRNRYHFMWDKEKGLVTDGFDKDLTLYYVLDRKKERQGYWQFGLSISFLSRLYMATGKKEFLDLAKEHYAYADGCNGVYSSALAHKLAWADALLYQATDDPRFLEGGKKVADHLVSVQRSDGRYHYREVVPNFENQDQTANLDIVCQFTTWIAQVRFSLATLENGGAGRNVGKRRAGKTYLAASNK